MPDTSALVGRNVRRCRIQAELTIAQLAAALDEHGHPIHPDSLSRLETGHRRVTVDDLTALSAVLGVKPKRLLRDADRCR